MVFNRKSEKPGQRIFGAVREGLFISHRDIVSYRRLSWILVHVDFDFGPCAFALFIKMRAERHSYYIISSTLLLL
jgi:hypothetical protein